MYRFLSENNYMIKTVKSYKEFFTLLFYEGLGGSIGGSTLHSP